MEEDIFIKKERVTERAGKQSTLFISCAPKTKIRFELIFIFVKAETGADDGVRIAVCPKVAGYSLRLFIALKFTNQGHQRCCVAGRRMTRMRTGGFKA